MAVRKAVAKKIAGGTKREKSRTDAEVDAFMRELDHPLKREIEVVRRDILDVDPMIQEGIKWKSPSFRTTDYFATVHLRATDGIQLILHMGAKVKATAKTGVDIADPAGLLKWLAKDRCMASLGAGKVFDKNRAALQAIIRDWIRYL